MSSPKRFGWTAGLAVIALALAGCGQEAAAPCGSADWAAVGFVDGAGGDARPSRYAQCPGFDQDDWQRGYLAGLSNFCTEGRVYRQARAGLSFPEICLPREEVLRAAHTHGARYWEITQEMWRLERRSRDDRITGQRLHRRAQYDALRRERMRYAHWPP